MSRWRIYIICVTIGVYGFFMETASGQQTRFERLSLEDGLSHASVYTILQDRTGFMWFGTLSGLNKFDGYHFTVYKSDPDARSSLSESFVNALFEDKKGQLWIGTMGGGLNRFDPVTEKFTHYLNGESDSAKKAPGRIRKILADVHNDEILWIGTTHDGLVRFNTRTRQVKTFRIVQGDSFAISHNAISDLVVDPLESGTVLWVGTVGGGLNRLHLPSGKFTHYLVQKSNSSPGNFVNINKIYTDPEQPEILWVGTDNGLIRFNTRTEKHEVFVHDPRNPQSLSDNRVYEIYLDRNKNFWVGTNNGLNIMERKHKTFTAYFHNPAIPTSLSQNSVFSIYQDKSGILWIGTDNGLNKYDYLKDRFHLYRNEPGNPSSLGHNYVRDIVPDPFREKTYWIATHGSGLDKFDRTRRVFSHFTHAAGNTNSPGNNEIYKLLTDYRGAIWVGHARGLDYFDPRTGVFRHYAVRYDSTGKHRLPEVIALFEDRDRVLWIGTWGGGVCRLDLKQFYARHKNPARTPLRSLTAVDENGNVTRDRHVVSFFEDESGNMWMGTVRSGIAIWNKNTGILRRLVHEPDNLNSLSHNYVTQIYQSRNKRIWVATRGGGLNEYHPATGTFSHYREKQGLSSDAVIKILEDRNGQLWLSTVNGLSRFDPATKLFKNYDSRDGLQSNQFYELSYYDERTGEIFVGGINGFNVFHPDSIKDNFYIPPVVFTKLEVHNAFNKGSTFRIKGICKKKSINLSHEDDIIFLEFAALNFRESTKNQFKYKMVPVNQKWIHLGEKNQINFTNLEPGVYTLHIQGSNNDGVWNKSGASLAIHIAPPWWQTRAAYLLYIILVASVLFTVDRFQRRRVIQKERERSKRDKEKLILQQAEELKMIDNIVRAINREFDLEKVLKSLLEQGLKLFPQAENGAVLLFDPKLDCFVFATAVAYDGYDYHQVNFSREEMMGQYAESAEEVEKGVFVVRHFKDMEGIAKFKHVPIPKSLILMSATWDHKLEGFIIFANLKKNDAFDKSDARKLKRFRQHAISAIVKARMLRELQKNNEKIVRTQEQLVTQEKLASLGQLTAGIAHEIKNPLNFVNNFAELSVEMLEELEQGLEGQKNNIPDDVYRESGEIIGIIKENAQKINQHGRRADSIIKNMLLHSRGQSGTFRETDINAMLEETLNLAFHGMRAQFPSFNATLELEMDSTVGSIITVPQNVNRVFINIIQNAFYAINSGNKKESDPAWDNDSAGYPEEPDNKKKDNPVIRIKTEKKNDLVEIRIRDNGPGIPESAQSKIFTPFYSTKPAGEGTGLGLSIAYDIIVHEHGGQIHFETEKGKFTEFIISLPVRKKNHQHQSANL